MTERKTHLRAGQIFHNLIDLMVKTEFDKELAEVVHSELHAVEVECIRDTTNNPDDKVEEAWLTVVQAMRNYCMAVMYQEEDAPIPDTDSSKVVSLFGDDHRGE